MTRLPRPAYPGDVSRPCPRQRQSEGRRAKRQTPRPGAGNLAALLRAIPNAAPELPDLNHLLAALHPVPRRRPPGDPELLALREGERHRRRGRFWPVPSPERGSP